MSPIEIPNLDSNPGEELGNLENEKKALENLTARPASAPNTIPPNNNAPDLKNLGNSGTNPNKPENHSVPIPKTPGLTPAEKVTEELKSSGKFTDDKAEPCSNDMNKGSFGSNA